VASGVVEARRRAEQVVAVIENKLYGPELLLIGHSGSVLRVTVSPDGKRLLTTSWDGTMRLWDTDTGKQLRVFGLHAGVTTGAAFSPDGKRVLVVGGDSAVHLWDLATGKEVRQMTGHTEQVVSCAFGPEGTAISGSHDGTMRLWNLNTGKEAGVFTGHTGDVRTVAYSGKAKLAATSDIRRVVADKRGDGSIRLWNLETGKEVRKLTGHTGGVREVCFAVDGKRLLSVGEDGRLRTWDVETGNQLKEINSAKALCGAFSPDGKRIVSGGLPDGIVRLWDAETGKELRQYEGPTGLVRSVAFFPDGKRIASASEGGTARIWRAPR